VFAENILEMGASSYYAAAQQLFAAPTLRVSWGVELRNGAIVGKDVELGGENWVLCLHNVSSQSQQVQFQPSEFDLPCSTWCDLLTGRPAMQHLVRLANRSDTPRGQARPLRASPALRSALAEGPRLRARLKSVVHRTCGRPRAGGD